LKYLILSIIKKRYESHHAPFGNCNVGIAKYEDGELTLGWKDLYLYIRGL